MNSIPAILLVEDSPDDAYFFQRALKRTGLPCRFEHVLDGGAAVQLLQAAQANGAPLPDVMFLDLKMPVLSGFEVLDWMRQQSLSEPPAVIVLSGSNQETDRIRAAELGAFDYLVKPISSEEIKERMESLSCDISKR